MTEAAHLELVAEVVAALQQDHEYRAVVPADDPTRVEAVRAAGRAAGRRLSWKVQTLAVGLGGGEVLVHVLVMKSTPERDAAAARRREAAKREALTRLDGADNDEGPPPPPA